MSGVVTAKLTSTTAPGKTFASRSELADHYKSDWHKYNLKRREASLPLLEEQEFQARWEAAIALRQEKEKKNGTDHLKTANRNNNGKKQHKKRQNEPSPRTSRGAEGRGDKEEEGLPAGGRGDDDVTMEEQKGGSGLVAESQETPEIDPKQSLFDSHRSGSLDDNVAYMQRKYGFFIPDQECLTDLEGLLGYLHEKIKLGHYCVYCEKLFPTWQACQNHMISKQHTKIRYEPGYWDELDPFYDFKRDDADFLTKVVKGKEATTDMDVDNENSDDQKEDDEEEDGWEDMSEGDDDEEESDELFKGFEKEIARFGLDVTPLGELVFPDGRVVGHRALRRYYKQRVRPASTGTAVVAAQRAAGERMFAGQVINIHQQHQGLKPSEIQGTGKGILVPLKQEGTGRAFFSTLSLYRYRAAVRKQRRGEEKGRRLEHRTLLPMNKMDKKANRLFNGVSVAHAPR